MAAVPDRAAPEGPLPTLPIVVARLLALYADEEYTADDIVAVLEADPGLSARLLRLANSAYYGFVGHVGTLQRSVVLLGEVTVQAVALGASLLRAWRGRRLPATVEDVWVHSYLCGMGCRVLAKTLPPRLLRLDPDALFLAGLLHDVGKILFLAEDAAGYGKDLEESTSSEDLRARELLRFGRDHAEAGGELLASWSLPPWMSALVRHHHDGEALRDELQAPLEVVAASHAAARGREPPIGEIVTAPLGDLLKGRIKEARLEAEEFYRAIS
ncbi:MAG: HDOD domain-containing protein [Deferrisomatales bacterium]|nr:HDOD domain-containing protein [Deferrisomatales bacterium]